MLMKNYRFSFFVSLAALFAFFIAGLTTAVAQDWAKARLEKSSRHGEWVNLKSGDRTLKAFVVYPETKEKTPVVLVIHEIFGLTDWVRSLQDQLAEAGYIAVAPDLLSGQTYSDIDGARKAISALSPEQVISDLQAAAAYAAKIPASNGTLAVAGFCWGGGWVWKYANSNPQLKGAYSFYGTAPDEASAVANISCPVYGFYGENDARVGATIPKAQDLMKAAGKTYEPVTYAGAGHGFMREGEAPEANPANKKARDDAWKRWKQLLAKLGK